ncbi:MAG: CoA pyrophosphatase, partial [Bacillota bacterium]|nr:CoA pyrophosphatase [Bacillota bacterium]
MELDLLKNLFKGREPYPEGRYSDFGVLVPLIEVDGSLHLLFEVRAASLNKQPGEISFPGGKVEKGETPGQAAVRETSEELLLKQESIELVGPLDYIVTPFNYAIYPYLGIIHGIAITDVRPNPGEVDRIFTVPLEYFLTNEPDSYHIRVHMEPVRGFPYELIPNGQGYN